MKEIEKIVDLIRDNIEETKNTLDRPILNQTKILNSIFTLGYYFGLSDILFNIDIDKYMELSEEIDDDLSLLEKFANKIYGLK